MTLRRVFFVLIAIACGPFALGQSPPAMNDDPEIEKRLLTVADGFELQLVASEPQIVNPVQINFDPQGRLWVLCIPCYPQLLPGQEPADFITVLADFEATGKARKVTRFAEGLMVPTGLIPGDGGVYVGQADKLLHLKDDGTGKAAKPRVLFAGFGTQDTHHTLNSFRWGPDSNLYFNQGIYIKSDVETPYGLRRYWGGGIWQLRPDRLKLDVYDRSIIGNNTWGHIFDPWGRSFCTSAWPADINLVLPDSPLNNSSDQSVVPPLALTKVGDGRHCGATFISGQHFPEDWQGNLVSGSFAGRLVYRYEVKDAGTKFAAKQLAPLITSKHDKFRPVDMQMGPDGALYIADWYDEIIQHNQIDFRDPRRDHARGRIWRVVAKNRPLTTPPKLVDVGVADLLDHLKSPDDWTRQQAKRVVAERGAKEIAPALVEWAGKLDAMDKDLPRHRLEALWAAQAIDSVSGDLLTKATYPVDGSTINEPRCRAAAMRVAGAWADRLPEALVILARGARDDDARVRLEAVLALSRVPSSTSFRAALGALDLPSDPLIDFALKRTAVILKPYWLSEFEKGTLTNIPPRHLAFALQTAGTAKSLNQFAMLLTSGRVLPGAEAEGYATIAHLGDVKLREIAWQWVGRKSANRPAAERALVLNALEKASREYGFRPSAVFEPIHALMEDADAAVAIPAIRLAGLWKIDAARPQLEKTATTYTGARGRAAISAWLALDSKSATDSLEKFAVANNPYGSRVNAIAGLASVDVKRAAPAAAKLLREPLGASDDPSDVYLAFLNRSHGAAALASALENERPSADAAKVGLRVLNAQGSPGGPLPKILHDAANLAAVVRDVTSADVRRLVENVQTQGDPRRGEFVFRRPTLGCMNCHAIGGAGGKVGPDLGTIGASSQLDYLVESILLPDKIIREGYNTAHVVTVDGKSLSGVVLRETPSDLVLRTALVDELVVPKKSIEERAGGGSLMPKGLAALVTDAELIDLVRFLSEVGKPGPFAVSHVPTARRWRVLTSDAKLLANLDDAALGKALTTNDRLTWETAYTKVSGELPIDELKRSPEVALAFVGCQIDALIAGPVTLKIANPAGLTIWLDGTPLQAAERMTIDLSRGVHSLDFRVDLSRRNGPLSCQMIATPGSAAQAQFVGGR